MCGSNHPALAWTGFKVNDPEVFSLAQFTVDGVELPFERQTDDVSQVYVVDLGEERVRQGEPVVVSFTFKTKTPRDGRLVHIDIDRPTKYDPSVVAAMRVMDFASRGDGGRVSEEADASALRYRYDGWLFPRAGLVFAWTLADEDPATKPQAADEDPAASARITTEASHPDAPRHSVPAARTSPAHEDQEGRPPPPSGIAGDLCAQGASCAVTVDYSVTTHGGLLPSWRVRSRRD